jgi:hypothetical protein
MLKNKICSKCKKDKSIDMFFKRRDRAIGFGSACKECIYEIYKNNDAYRKYARKYGRDYFKTKKGKKNSIRARIKRKLRGQSKAHDRVKYALKTGRLIKMPCERCGDKTSEAHHDDYSKPLNVIWLCSLHHKQRHKFLRQQQKQPIQGDKK